MRIFPLSFQTKKRCEEKTRLGVDLFLRFPLFCQKKRESERARAREKRAKKLLLDFLYSFLLLFIVMDSDGLSIHCVGNYDLGKTIGQGQFGKVKLGRHVITREIVAIKIIIKSRLDANTLRMVYREIQIMKLLRHTYIIQLYQVVETEKHLFLIMEYAQGGEVLDYIVTHGRLPERESRRFFCQIMVALHYCHGNPG